MTNYEIYDNFRAVEYTHLPLPIGLDGRIEVLPLLEENARRNIGQCNGVADVVSSSSTCTYPRVCRYIWGHPVASIMPNDSPAFDFVVAADCIYDEEGVDPILSAFRLLAGSSTQIFVAFDRCEEPKLLYTLRNLKS